MTARISVVIPTVGRASLARAVASCADADQIVVVYDGATPKTVAKALDGLPQENVTFAQVDSGGDHGYLARTVGISLATGTHLAFLDDDDVFTPGAIDAMREAAADWPVIFRMDDPLHGVIWQEPGLWFGNIGTPMLLVPNVPEKLGKWEPHAPGLDQPGGDFNFITGCVAKMGAPTWDERSIATVSPDTPRPVSITVVTPWLDHPELAEDFMAAMQALRRYDRLVVVDDGSDEPAVVLGFGDFATIRFDRNEGFHRCCNEGLRAARTDAVLFLNNDIAPTSADWLEQIRAALEPGVLVGADLRTVAHGNVDGFDLPYLDGWCLAGMTADLRELGGFDEGYAEPAYFGDNDLCFRARLAGMTLRQAKVGLHHKRNVTAGAASDAAVAAATEANRERFAASVREALCLA